MITIHSTNVLSFPPLISCVVHWSYPTDPEVNSVITPIKANGVARKPATRSWTLSTHLRPFEGVQRWLGTIWARRPKGWHFPQAACRPALNLRRSNGALILEAALPGLHKEDIRVNLAGTTLTIAVEPRADQKSEASERYLCEVDQGRIYRTVDLPVRVDPARVKAVYKDGMLKLNMPVPEPEPPQGVDVSVD